MLNLHFPLWLLPRRSRTEANKLCNTGLAVAVVLVYENWIGTFGGAVETWIKNVRFAIRRLRRRPLFTVIAVLTLAIGVGANSAIFTLVNAALYRQLPLERPHELVDVYRSVVGFSHATFSYPDLVELREDTRDVFSDLGGSRLALLQADTETGVEALPAEVVTGNYFPMLGVKAHLGRTLLIEDDVAPGGHPVVMLGYAYWQRRYGGDEEIVGQQIQLNGRAYQIIGVAPRSFTGTLRSIMPDIYAPVMMTNHLQPGDLDELVERGNNSTFLKARLRSGVTLAQAETALAHSEQAFKESYPEQWPVSDEIHLVPTADVIMNPMVDSYLKAAAFMLLAVVGLVLLITCANLASFLLAQMAERRKEIALRLALGSARRQLFGQLLTESLLLSTLDGAAGIALGVLLLRILVNADLPLPFPLALDLGLNGPVVVFSLGITLLAGLIFGLVPALQASRIQVNSVLRAASVGSGGERGSGRLRNGLVSTQVAVSMLLLLGAGLFLRTLQARTAVDPGFGYQPAALMTVQIPSDRYTEEQGRTFWREYFDRLQGLPGVEAAGLTGDINLSVFNNWSMPIEVAGVDPEPGMDFHPVDWSAVSQGFLAANGIAIVEGRPFDSQDGAEGEPVAIVSQAMAERFYPGRSAVGATFRSNDVEHTIVGVARDSKIRSLGEEPRSFVYRPFEQNYSSFMTVVASTTGDPEKLALDMLALSRSLDPEVQVFETKSMERHLAVALLPHRLAALVVSAFSGIALLLASIGLYGMVSYSVASRQREVGIRMSLGADPQSISKLLVKNGLVTAAIGGVVGLLLGALGARWIASLLFGVGSWDPITFLVVPLILGVVTVLAAWLPARRASRLDPVRALRN